MRASGKTFPIFLFDEDEIRKEEDEHQDENESEEEEKERLNGFRDGQKPHQ